VQPQDGAGHDEALDLRGALEECVGPGPPSVESAQCVGVRLRVQPRLTTISIALRRSLPMEVRHSISVATAAWARPARRMNWSNREDGAGGARWVAQNSTGSGFEGTPYEDAGQVLAVLG
jgi:hypothetical protein